MSQNRISQYCFIILSFLFCLVLFSKVLSVYIFYSRCLSLRQILINLCHEIFMKNWKIKMFKIIRGKYLRKYLLDKKVFPGLFKYSMRKNKYLIYRFLENLKILSPRGLSKVFFHNWHFNKRILPRNRVNLLFIDEV